MRRKFVTGKARFSGARNLYASHKGAEIREKDINTQSWLCVTGLGVADGGEGEQLKSSMIESTLGNNRQFSF